MGGFGARLLCRGVSSALPPLRGCSSAPPAACIMCNIGVISPSENWYGWFRWSFYKEYFNPVIAAFLVSEA